MEFQLTTGQVIDSLKMGEHAINQKGDRIGYSEKGDLLYIHEGEEQHSEDKVALFYAFVQKDLWKIIPTYVSFHEAMEALEDGLIVEYHWDEQTFTFNKENPFVIGEIGHFDLSFHDLFVGKWIISQEK